MCLEWSSDKGGRRYTIERVKVEEEGGEGVRGPLLRVGVVPDRTVAVV